MSDTLAAYRLRPAGVWELRDIVREVRDTAADRWETRRAPRGAPARVVAAQRSTATVEFDAGTA